MRAVSDAKAALRRVHLHQLRNFADPLALRVESAQLCTRLYEHILSLRHHCAMTPLWVCGFLPMRYELDLRPLFARIWNEHPPGEVRVFVPAVLTGLASAMLFVEIFDEADLHASCAPRGPYGIVEPTDEVLARLFAADEPPPRRGIACDTCGVLFPARSSVPPALTLPGASECVLVLTPGVLFGGDGARLGKGGGYYDRFLGYHRRMGTRIITWGIARDMQITKEGVPCGREGERGDEHVNAIVTPTQFLPCEAPRHE